MWASCSIHYIRSSHNNRDSYEIVYSVELSGSCYGAEQSATYMFSHPDYVRPGKHTAMLMLKSLYGSVIHSLMFPAI